MIYLPINKFEIFPPILEAKFNFNLFMDSLGVGLVSRIKASKFFLLFLCPFEYDLLRIYSFDFHLFEFLFNFELAFDSIPVHYVSTLQ